MKGLTVINLNVGNIGIKVSLNGFSKIVDKTTSSTHSHANFEYHYVVKGNSKLKLDNDVLSVNENNSILVFPDKFHKFIKTDAQSNVLSFSFVLKKSKRGTDYYKFIEDKIRKSDYIFFEQGQEITDLIYKIISIVYSKNIFVLEQMRSLFIMFFTKIFNQMIEKNCDSSKEITTQEYDTRIYVIEEYFNEHYMENISLNNLSKILYLGTQQTDRIIKKIYGVGFKNRLTKIRIKSAIELLNETNKTINEISELVGYNSYNGFYSAFKKIMGISPEEYRKNKSTD